MLCNASKAQEVEKRSVLNLKTRIVVLRLKDALDQKWLSSLNHEQPSFTKALQNTDVKIKSLRVVVLLHHSINLSSRRGP